MKGSKSDLKRNSFCPQKQVDVDSTRTGHWSSKWKHQTTTNPWKDTGNGSEHVGFRPLPDFEMKMKRHWDSTRSISFLKSCMLLTRHQMINNRSRIPTWEYQHQTSGGFCLKTSISHCLNLKLWPILDTEIVDRTFLTDRRKASKSPERGDSFLGSSFHCNLQWKIWLMRQLLGEKTCKG